MDHVEEARNAITSIRTDMEKMDKIFDRTYTVREKIISKLESIVDTMKIDPDDKPSSIEAKVGIINTLASQLNDTDKQQLNRVGIKSKIEAEESDTDHKKAVAEYLKNMSHRKENYTPWSNEEVEEELEQTLEEHDIHISDAELKIDAMDLD